MALSYSNVGKPDVIGKRKITFSDVTFDASYVTDGEDFAASGSTLNVAQNKVVGVEVIGGNAASLKYRFGYNTSAKKLLAFASNSGELVAYAVGDGDIKGSANTNVGIASGTLPTNGALVSSLASANNTTAFTIAASPDVPRNVSISFKNTNAGASTGNAVSVVITGTFRGAAQTETISFTALELTSTTQNEVATKYGSKPFDTVTSITNPTAQPSGWQHSAGIGSKLGLPSDLFTPIEADVTKLTKNGANLSPSSIVDTTNMTVNFGTLADGDEASIQYRAAAQQVASGVDLSGVTVRVAVYSN